MNELELDNLEKCFFGDNDFMVLPKLLPIYYERKQYALVYYLSNIYSDRMEPVKFYLLLSSKVLNLKNSSQEIYISCQDSWFDIMHQYRIYWRHVVEFVKLFNPDNIPDWFQFMCDQHYEDKEAQKLEFNQKKTQEKRPSLVTFDNVKWKVWQKYNDNNVICINNTLNLYQLYNKDNIKVYSYMPKRVCASMHVITDGSSAIMLDCGCELEHDVSRPIPIQEILAFLGVNKIDAVLVSHAHFDHYGSLNKVKEFPVYMTEESMQIIKRMSKDIYTNAIHIVNNFDYISAGNFTVQFIPNGHILGSVMMDISNIGIGGKTKRIIYSGDFCLSNQFTCPGLHMEDIAFNKQKIDLFITESTYGYSKDLLNLSQYEEIFTYITKQIIKAGKKIVIPCFAVGRAQETAMLLRKMINQTSTADNIVRGIKILIDGMAAGMTEYYQNTIDKSIIGNNIVVNKNEKNINLNIFDSNIILASSGMFKPGSSSYNYMQEMMDMKNISVIKVGFIHKDEEMLMSILQRRYHNITYYDIPMSAHAGHEELIKLADFLSADITVYVHGNGISNL